MNLPLVVLHAFRRQFLPTHYHFIRNFSCQISTNVSMASQRLVWVDLEVRRLGFIALFYLSHYKTKIVAKPKEVAGEEGWICYPSATFVKTTMKFSRNTDYKVDGLGIHYGYLTAATTSYLLTSIRDGVFIDKYSHMDPSPCRDRFQHPTFCCQYLRKLHLRFQNVISYLTANRASRCTQGGGEGERGDGSQSTIQHIISTSYWKC